MFSIGQTRAIQKGAAQCLSTFTKHNNFSNYQWIILVVKQFSIVFFNISHLLRAGLLYYKSLLQRSS